MYPTVGSLLAFAVKLNPAVGFAENWMDVAPAGGASVVSIDAEMTANAVQPKRRLADRLPQ
jgi:hypothetical protein